MTIIKILRYFILKLLNKNYVKPKKVSTYENLELIKNLIKKNYRYHNSLSKSTLTLGDMRSLYLLLTIKTSDKKINVIDFGGQLGTHFLIYKLIKPEQEVDWFIVETPTLKKHSQLFHKPNLYFSDSLHCFNNKNIDILFANSSLQYTKDPIETLKEWCNLNPEKIIVTRTPFSKKTSYKKFQWSELKNNGPRELENKVKNKIVSYPIIILKLSEVLEILSKNYTIELLIEEEKNIFQFKNDKIGNFGFIASKRL